MMCRSQQCQRQPAFDPSWQPMYQLKCSQGLEPAVNLSSHKAEHYYHIFEPCRPMGVTSLEDAGWLGGLIGRGQAHNSQNTAPGQTDEMGLLPWSLNVERAKLLFLPLTPLDLNRLGLPRRAVDASRRRGSSGGRSWPAACRSSAGGSA